MTKRFPLRVVLTAFTGRLLTEPKGEHDNGIGDLYDILNWMTRDDLFTHQLPRAFHECKPWLLRWFPELQRADDRVAELDGEPNKESWLVTWMESLALPDHYDVPQIPQDDHDRIDPYDELVQMRGTDEGIVIVNERTNHDPT